MVIEFTNSLWAKPRMRWELDFFEPPWCAAHGCRVPVKSEKKNRCFWNLIQVGYLDLSENVVIASK